MSVVRGSIRGAKTAWNLGRSVVLQYERWRSAKTHPKLHIERLTAPYWGASMVSVTVRNAGSRSARDCRYCLRYVFTMSSSQPDRGDARAVAQYASDAFEVRPGESVTVQVHATDDRCGGIVLSGLVSGSGAASRAIEAVACRDRYGTLYRFVDSGGEAHDVWRDSPMDRALKRTTPAWTAWLGQPPTSENKAWSSTFQRVPR